jgi:hypothetical protein
VLKFSRRTTIITLAIVVATSVAAFAFWTGIGVGNGQAQTGTTGQGLTVKQTNQSNPLSPGATATLSGNFDNPNNAAVFVGSVKAVISGITPGPLQNANERPCSVNDYQLVNDTATVNTNVPGPGTGVGSWSGIVIKMLHTTDNQDNCKNATVHLTYTIV